MWALPIGLILIVLGVIWNAGSKANTSAKNKELVRQREIERFQKTGKIELRYYDESPDIFLMYQIDSLLRGFIKQGDHVMVCGSDEVYDKLGLNRTPGNIYLVEKLDRSLDEYLNVWSRSCYSYGWIMCALKKYDKDLIKCGNPKTISEDEFKQIFDDTSYYTASYGAVDRKMLGSYPRPNIYLGGRGDPVCILGDKDYVVYLYNPETDKFDINIHDELVKRTYRMLQMIQADASGGRLLYSENGDIQGSLEIIHRYAWWPGGPAER